MTNTTKLVLTAISCLIIRGIAESSELSSIARLFGGLSIIIIGWLIFGPKPKKEKPQTLEEFGATEGMDTMSSKGLMCPKCKVKNPIMNLNKNPNATIYSAGFVRLYKDAHVMGLFCFQCEHFSEWAIWGKDLINSPGVRLDGIQYFATYPITQKIKELLLIRAGPVGIIDIANKIDKIKIKK